MMKFLSLLVLVVTLASCSKQVDGQTAALPSGLPSEIPAECIGATPEALISCASPSPSVSVSVSPSPSPVAFYGVDSPTQTSPVGILGSVTWHVSSDLNAVEGLAHNALIGRNSVPETFWNDRSVEHIHSLRARSNSYGTLKLNKAFTEGVFDAVLLCKSGTADCLNTVNTQLAIGPYTNNLNHFLNGPDKTGTSATGGSSFTTIFVAAREGVNPMFLMEHRDSTTTKSPFLGWIGNDLKFSIHGSAGNSTTGPTYKAVTATGDYNGNTRLKIYTAVFDRAQAKVRLYIHGATDRVLVEKPTAVGDGPDNNIGLYLTMGRRTPGVDAKLWMLEQISYPRALSAAELCELHKHLNAKYHFEIPSSEIKPCI